MITGLTMILANAGIQIFNSWQNNRQNSSLQAKREEFERAAHENNRKRMLQIMREGHELTLQLEKENHQNRLKDLHTDFDRLLQKLAYSAAMDQWPLNVLPIVMKNQALGNLLAKQEEHIALHCIFTPSNCKEFNRHVFPEVESALEDFFSEHCSTISKHPVLFYSGAWKTNDSPTGIQIDSMQSALANLPTLLISPFFRPTDHKLVIQVKLWGTGKKADELFNLPDIENNDFQRVYTEKGDYIGDEGLKNDIIEDLVPYLECIIGYISDTYFWSVFNLEPILPSLINKGLVNTDGMKYLVRYVKDLYESLLNKSEEKSKLNLFNRCSSIKIFSSLFPMWSDDEKKKRTEQLLLSYCNSRASVTYDNVDEAVKKTVWLYEDCNFIDKLTGFIKQNGEEGKYMALYEVKDKYFFVDLGLSVKWARFNLGASSPEDYGNYYAWGETSPKSEYTKENSKTYGREMEDIGGNPDYDAATAFLGRGIRLPSKNEFKELVDNCESIWTTHNGVKGSLFISKINGNCIFLPAAGCCLGTSLLVKAKIAQQGKLNSIIKTSLITRCADISLQQVIVKKSISEERRRSFISAAFASAIADYSLIENLTNQSSTQVDVDKSGCYWSSTPNEYGNDSAYGIDLSNNSGNKDGCYDRFDGFTIRPVSDF